MTYEPDRELAASILRHAGEAAMQKQLRRMPSFAVPRDRKGTFRHLLEKLDRVAADKAAGTAASGSLRKT